MTKSQTAAKPGTSSEGQVEPNDVDETNDKRVTAGEPLETGSRDGSFEGLDDIAALPKGTLDPVYEAKARVLNHAVCFLYSLRSAFSLSITPHSRDINMTQIQEIGMGWYQWQLFIVVGFGWANDNLWPIVTSLICE